MSDLRGLYRRGVETMAMNTEHLTTNFVLERVLSAPISLVFAALSARTELCGRRSRESFVSRSEGVTLSVQLGETDTVFRVESARPMSKVRWTRVEPVLEGENPFELGDARVASLIEFRLEERPAWRTNLRLEHAGSVLERPLYDLRLQGWLQFVAKFARYAETGLGSPIRSARA